MSIKKLIKQLIKFEFFVNSLKYLDKNTKHSNKKGNNINKSKDFVKEI